MMFEATLTDRGLRGHFFLENISAENGMHRGHCWVNQEQAYLGAQLIPSRLRISGKYRRYRPGSEGWTLTKIESVEVLP